ncbi:MAG: YcgL domain-containing protein [Pseudomonadota bacterium]
MEVDIYASRDYNDYYLYLHRGADVDAVLPEALRKRLGRLRPALTLTLTVETRLVRADAARVLEALTKDGFYLQLPPPAEER